MGDQKQPENKAKILEFTGGEKINPVKSVSSTLDIEQQSIGEKADVQEQDLISEDERNVIVHADSGITALDVFQALHDSEIGLARLFTRMFRNKFCFNTSLGKWLIYKGSCWHLDTRNEQIDACRDLYKLMKPVIQQHFNGLHKKTIAALNREIKKAASISQMKNILSQGAAGKDGLGVPGESFDNIIGKVGAPNGVIDVKTGELLPSHPELYITKQVGVPYDPEAPEPVLFKKFLHEVFEYPINRNKVNMSDEDFKTFCEEQSKALVEYIQTLFGYALLGDCKEHIFVCFWGIGRNGKGVLVRIINKVLGDYAAEINPAILLSSKPASPDSPSPSIADLQGMRLAVASETNQAQRFDTSTVKRLTGGDTMVYRKLYANDYVRFEPTHTLILQTNFRPNAPAEDVALWDRMHSVPFLRRFINDPDPENIYETQKDKDLEDRLPEEFLGILKWTLEGARKYLEKGLNPPECVKSAVDEYRLSGDFIAEFIDECCNTGKDLKVRTTAFAQTLNEWRKLQGYKSPLSSSVITERLEYKGYLKRKSSYMCYRGLELNEIGVEYLKPVHERKLDFGTENPFMDPGMKHYNETAEWDFESDSKMEDEISL